MASSSLQTGPWRIPARLGDDLSVSRTGARPASYVAGSFFSPVSGVYSGVGSSASSLSRSLRTTFPSVQRPKPGVEQKLANVRQMEEESKLEDANHGFNMIIPTDKSDISVAWAIVVANQYLIKTGKPLIRRSSSSVTNFSVQDCKKSVGDFSCTYKIDLEVKDEDSKGRLQRFSFIAKFLPREDPLRMYVFDTDVFRKESELYFDVLPAIKACLRFITRRRSVPGQDLHDNRWTDMVDDLIPECVYSSYNPDGVGVLVFKSCTDDGFKVNENPEGFSLAQVLRIVRALAKFHAAAKTLLKIRGVDFVKQVYPSLKREMLTSESLLPEVRAHLQTYSEFLGTVSSYPRGAAFRDVSHEACLEMQNQFETLKCMDLSKLLAGLCRSGPPSLTTLVHGELWEKNVLLAEDVTSAAAMHHTGEGVKIVDWKNAKIGSATLDLAFLVLSSTDHALRSESLDEILRVYHVTFTSTFAKLVPDAPKLAYEDLVADYFKSLPFAMLQTVIMFVLELQFIDSNLAGEKDDAKLERLAEKLKIYEYRALNLFRDVDLNDYGSLDDEVDDVTGVAAGKGPQPPRINEEDEEGQRDDDNDDVDVDSHLDLSE